MRYSLTHRTTYAYEAAVHQSYHLLHLSPREIANQTIHDHRVTIEPSPGMHFQGTDYFGNPYAILTIEEDHRKLVVEAMSEIDVRAADAGDLGRSMPWQTLAKGDPAGLVTPDIAQFTAPSRHGRRVAALAEYARASFQPGRATLAGAEHLMQRIYDDFTFDSSATDVSTPVEDVLEKRRGVCQDFAHLMIAAMRALNLPVRYVSGYILTHPPAGQPRLQGADASHAWVSAWAPETGWVDFDPTNNIIPRGEHIAIAYGRDYDDVAPIGGVLLGGGAHTVDVAVDMVPLGAN